MEITQPPVGKDTLDWTSYEDRDELLNRLNKLRIKIENEFSN
ncbi:MAG: hypothetical protein PUJ51_00340 [Clostridiales bacterium]|jgi:hypothetical protein|nr:hypothetical protein [Terrisporobacter sp.]MDD7752952.1 hypothetical protein [Clostridiales bacterium]MDY4135153.1 hypothetical protein [Terrisporobacter sp.]